LISLARVARWFIFKQKIPNLGKFWMALDWKMFICVMAIWNILRTVWKFFDHLVHSVFIWYIFPVLASCTKKNLATLPSALWVYPQSEELVKKSRQKSSKWFDEHSDLLGAD
jgi:hypothetical protein